MEDQRDDVAPSEQAPSNASSWWSSDFEEKFGSVSLGPPEDIVNEKEEIINSDQDVLFSPQRASQILWRTGMRCEPIPDGFYSVILYYHFETRMATFIRALNKAHQVLYLKGSPTIVRSKLMPLLPSAFIGLENLRSQLRNHNQNHHGCVFSFRCSSTSTNPDIDLSNEDSKRQLFNRLLYRSKQRGFLELDLILGKWVEDNIHSLDADGIRALINVLDLENPDLWKWLTGQEQPPEALKTNPVFTGVKEKVMNNLNKHASPETRTPPGKQWVRGWDDFKKGRDGPITGNQ